MTRITHRHLLAVLLLAPGWLFAQTAPQKTSTAAAPATEEKTVATDKKKTTADEEKIVKLETVEVTGSRLRSLVGEQPALPVITLDHIELEQRGITRLADARWAIPQLGAALGFNDNLVNSGTSRAQTVSTSFALRGISGNSTLILIDGRRIPHSGQEAPGGAGGREDYNIDGIPASAIERIEVLPQGASAIYGSDAVTGVVNIILKKNYKGNELQFTYDNTFDGDAATKTVTLTGGYRTGKLSAFYTLSASQQNSLATQDRWWSKTNDMTPYGASYNANIYAPYSGSGTLSNGYYPYTYSSSFTYGSTTVYSIPSGSTGNFTTSQVTSGATTPLYDSAAYGRLIDPSHSRSGILKLNYDFASWLRPYLTLRKSEFTNYTTGTPITLTRYLSAGANGNPFSTGMYLNKVFYDLPRSSTTSKQNNAGITFGADGQIAGDWRYDVGVSWARNLVKDQAYNNGWDSTKLSAAIAAGVILTYDSSTPGTDPNAAGLMKSLLATSFHKDTSDTTQYSVQADGTVWNGWAGPVRAAVGGEYEHDTVKFYREPAISYVLSADFSRNISAGFAEVAVPLLSEKQHIPLVHRVELTGAARMEQYSDMGQHTSPSLSALYQPVKWLTFRASRSNSFKAPKLYDLQAPYYTTTTTVYASSGVKDTQRNNEAVVGTYTLKTGGQPDLKPETSITRNLGVVLDVPGRWFKGLSVSVDYWDINYKDQVSSPSYQNLITYFPWRVTRDSTGVITGFDTSMINQAKVTTKGVDYRVTYQRPFSFGTLMASAGVSDTGKLMAIATPSSKPTFRYMPTRSSGSLFWNQGPWTAGVSVNYQTAFQNSAGATLWYPSYIEWDPQVAYDFGRDRAVNSGQAGFFLGLLKDTKLSVTIINVFDRDPSDSAAAINRITMDPRLRRYVLTLTKKF